MGVLRKDEYELNLIYKPENDDLQSYMLLF